MNHLGIIAIVWFTTLLSFGDGLKCYVCTSSDVSFDEACENGNTTLLPSVDCSVDVKYCTYTKTEWHTFSGANSVLRSCSDSLLYSTNGQHELEDGNLTVWYQSCGMDLCNNAKTFNADHAVTVFSTLVPLILVTLLQW